MPPLVVAAVETVELETGAVRGGASEAALQGGMDVIVMGGQRGTGQDGKRLRQWHESKGCEGQITDFSRNIEENYIKNGGKL
jgi:hypothetical protein